MAGVGGLPFGPDAIGDAPRRCRLGFALEFKKIVVKAFGSGLDRLKRTDLGLFRVLGVSRRTQIQGDHGGEDRQGSGVQKKSTHGHKHMTHTSTVKGKFW